MTQDTKHTNIRCFLALTIPNEAQAELASIQKSLQDNGAKARWVKADNIHITLRFLGNRPLKKIEQIAKDLPLFCPNFRSFKITLHALDGFPDLNNPKVIWAGISDGSDPILKIYHAVNEGLARLGIPKEREEFVPHLTIARCKTSEESFSTATAIKKSCISPVQAEINSIVFYQSTLSSRGPAYEVIQAFP